MLQAFAPETNQLPDGKIFLTGLPGSGKTTLGKLISEKTKRPFFDLDKLIESATNATISEIFSTNDEAYFRSIESEVLRNFSFPENAIVALGGGTPCFQNNMQWLKNNGTIIFIHADTGVIYERLKQTNNERPLLKNNLKEKLEQLKTERWEFYLQADFIWNNN